MDMTFQENALKYWNELNWQKINPYDKRYWQAIVGAFIYKNGFMRVTSKSAYINNYNFIQPVNGIPQIMSFFNGDDLSLPVRCVKEILYWFYDAHYYDNYNGFLARYIKYNKDFEKNVEQIDTSLLLSQKSDMPSFFNVFYLLYYHLTEDLFVSILLDLYCYIKNSRYCLFYIPNYIQEQNQTRYLTEHFYYSNYIQRSVYLSGEGWDEDVYRRDLEEAGEVFKDIGDNFFLQREEYNERRTYMSASIQSSFRSLRTIHIYASYTFTKQMKIELPLAGFPFPLYSVFEDYRTDIFPNPINYEIPPRKEGSHIVFKLNTKNDVQVLDLTFPLPGYKISKDIIRPGTLNNDEPQYDVQKGTDFGYLSFSRMLLADTWADGKFV